MPTRTNKQRILDALQNLADDASIDEAIELLYFLDQVEKSPGPMEQSRSLEDEPTKRWAKRT